MAPEWVSPFASFFSSYTLRPRRPKAALKAKWDHCFERLLDNGLDASRQSRAFWDDLLLLDVNAPLLERKSPQRLAETFRQKKLDFMVPIGNKAGIE